MKTLLTIGLVLLLTTCAIAGEYYIADQSGMLYVDDVGDGLIFDLDADGSMKAFFVYNGHVVSVMGYTYFIGQATGAGLDIWGNKGGSTWDYLGRY